MGISLDRDKSRAVVDLHHAAGIGNAPFRENNDRTAFVDQVDHGFHRHRRSRIDQQVIDLADQCAEKPVVDDAAMDHENRVHRQKER